MDNITLYKSLFLDSFVSHLFFSLSDEYFIWAMSLFHRADNSIIVCIASFGYMFSIIFNYFVGILLYKFCFKYLSRDLYMLYKKTKHNFNDYWFIILSLTLVPIFGKLLFVFLGFFNTKPAATLVFGTLIKILYYTYYLMFI
jgi:membrane protein YqaA with SNARE-associated domain